MMDDLKGLREKTCHILESNFKDEYDPSKVWEGHIHDHIDAFVTDWMSDCWQSVNLWRKITFPIGRLQDSCRCQTVRIYDIDSDDKDMYDDDVDYGQLVRDWDLVDGCLDMYSATIEESLDGAENTEIDTQPTPIPVSYTLSDLIKKDTSYRQVVETPFVGDGVTQHFSGFLTTVSLPYNECLSYAKIESVNNQHPKFSIDSGVERDGYLYGDVTGDNNSINYDTGFVNITFACPPAKGQRIYAEIHREKLSKPDILVFSSFDISIRPVVDKEYILTLEARIRPVHLIEFTNFLETDGQRDFIAYNVAKQIARGHI